MLEAFINYLTVYYALEQKSAFNNKSDDKTGLIIYNFRIAIRKVKKYLKINFIFIFATIFSELKLYRYFKIKSFTGFIYK